MENDNSLAENTSIQNDLSIANLVNKKIDFITSLNSVEKEVVLPNSNKPNTKPKVEKFVKISVSINLIK